MPKQNCSNCGKWENGLFPVNTEEMKNKENVANINGTDTLKVCNKCCQKTYKRRLSVVFQVPSEPGTFVCPINKRVKSGYSTIKFLPSYLYILWIQFQHK